jgi:anti-anti-sigma regulatory factor
MTISNIEPAYAELCAAFQQEGPILLDMAEVADADLTFVQLIESARLSAAKAQRRLVLSAPTHTVREILERGGFLDDGGPGDRSAFWLQGADAQ